MSMLLRTLSIVIVYTICVAAASAQDRAESLFREGNALFRAGVYQTALVRYREAENAGLASPTLYYNTGVAAYKVGQYEVAEVAFRRARDDAALAALASYNLGLTYRKVGRPLEAEESFRFAASVSSSRRLANLARRAADAVAIPAARVNRGDRPNSFRHPASRPQAEPAGELRVLMSARLGRDDNVYRSPSSPYVDLGALGQPVVTPVVQSASYMPIDVLAEYTMQNEPRDTLFRFAYRLDGDFYESEFSNANRISQWLEIGADIADTDDAAQRRRRLRSSFYVTGHDETNFDPDTGVDRDFNGVDISDRLTYKGAGVRLNYQQALRRWAYGFDVRMEGRQYEDAAELPSYDHDLSYLRFESTYSSTPKTTLEGALLKYRRVYDNRLARDSNGDLIVSNDTLEYDYSGLEIGVSYQISRPLELSASLLHLVRKDQFVGYFDSTQDQLWLKARYRPNRRFRLSAAINTRTFDYPNAFAFDDPTAGERNLDMVTMDVRAEYQVTSQISIWGQLLTDDVTSTDPRIEYARTRSMLGMLWRY